MIGANGAAEAQAGATQWNGILRENAYLMRRCAQLQDDVTDLSAALDRARRQLERVDAGRRSGGAPSPLSGGR